MVEALPPSRVRSHHPEVMATVDATLAREFERAGWSVLIDEFETRHMWSCSRGGVVERVERLRGVNVVGVKEGEDRAELVVVAHHDTVPGSSGADDNGSGVAALVELARLLEPLRFRHSLVLAAVDHEELGFHGSRRLVEHLSRERRVRGAFVYEMLAFVSSEPGSQRLPAGIGAIYPQQVHRVRRRRDRGDFTAVLYRRSALRLATSFAEALTCLAGDDAALLLRAPTDLPLVGRVLERAVPFARDFARSDHVPFWDAGLPAVQITDTANFRNPHYHRASDLPHTLDYERLADVVAATALALEHLAVRSDE